MTKLEDRLRSGLAAEAEARRHHFGSGAHTDEGSTATSGIGAGVRVAVAAAAAVVVVIGGISLLTTGGTGAASGAGSASESISPGEETTTTVMRADETPPPGTLDGPAFEAIPFTGTGWEFYVGEAPNPPTDQFKVCYRFDPTGVATEASSIGPSGCGDWPAGDGRYFVDVQRALGTETGTVLLVDLTTNPVDMVKITSADGIDIEVEPFTLPNSGKQFAVAEVPAVSGTVTVELLDAAGDLLDRVSDVAISAPPPEWTTSDGAPAWSWIETAGLVRSGEVSHALDGVRGKLAGVKDAVAMLRDASVLQFRSTETHEDAFFLLEDGSDTVVYVGWEELGSDGFRIALPSIDETFQVGYTDGVLVADRLTDSTADFVADGLSEVATVRFFQLSDSYASSPIVQRDDVMGGIAEAVFAALDLPKNAPGSLTEDATAATGTSP